MKIGILGAGSMGSEHFDCYKGIPNIEVSAIYTRSSEKAKNLTKKLGVKVVTDFNEIIRNDLFLKWLKLTFNCFKVFLSLTGFSL